MITWRALAAFGWLGLASGCGDDGAERDTRVDANNDTDAVVETGGDTSDEPSDVHDDGADAAPAESDDADASEVERPDARDDATDTLGDDATDTLGDDATDTLGDIAGSTEPLDPDLIPCEHPEYWPFSMSSEDLPLRVHYRVPRDEPGARESLALLAAAWRFEVDTLGFDAPLDDQGSCGPDGHLDVFTWRDAEYPFVDVWDEDDATPWDDGFAYMVMDPWGEFGGDELAVTLAHELNHACQAAYDWSEVTFLYEATSTFVEDEVFDDSDSYQALLYDFQGHPDWSLDRDDGYETWYMYGAMLYFQYLRDRFFDGDASYIAEMWHGLRSPADHNEPDYIDSLDALLGRAGRSFADTIIEFARWRWYVGERDDGLHLEEAGAFPEDAQPLVEATLPATGGSLEVRPMMLGTTYLDIAGAPDGPASVMLTLETTVTGSDVQWVVQALPGIAPGEDGELLTLPAEVALVSESGAFARTIVVTALPGLERDIDPDTRSDERFAVTLRVTPGGPPP